MVTAEFTILPIGTNSTSVGDSIKLIPPVLEKYAGIKYEITGMGTNLEGDIDIVWTAIRDVQETLFEHGLQRIYTVIKIDDRRDKQSSLSAKVTRVTPKQ